MPRELYIFFKNYDEEGLPSFTKFAKMHGFTTEELVAFRRHKRFDEAFRECLLLRRDLLIDRALCRRFDGSVTKFLLSEDGAEADEIISEIGQIQFNLTVLGEEVAYGK